MDVGPATRSSFASTIADAGTVLWNGPVGVFEDPRFAEGTEAVAEAVAAVVLDSASSAEVKPQPRCGNWGSKTTSAISRAAVVRPLSSWKWEIFPAWWRCVRVVRSGPDEARRTVRLPLTVCWTSVVLRTGPCSLVANRDRWEVGHVVWTAPVTSGASAETRSRECRYGWGSMDSGGRAGPCCGRLAVRSSGSKWWP